MKKFLNTLQVVAPKFLLSLLKFLMIRIGEIYSDTYGNYHRGIIVLCIIMSFLMPVDIEMLFAVRFASQLENNY
jgi:hypothetical protein